MQIRKCALIEMFSLVLIGMFSPFFHIIGSRIGAFGLFPFLDGDTISLFDEGPETTRITCTVSMGTRNYVFRTRFRTKSTGRIAARARTDIVRKETHFKVSALCISYFRTVQTFLEAVVATSHPKCNTSLESPC